MVEKARMYFPSGEKSGNIYWESFKRPRIQRNNPNQVGILIFMSRSDRHNNYLHDKPTRCLIPLSFNVSTENEE